MNSVISVLPTDATQEIQPFYEATRSYAVHAANWKRAYGSGPIIGTFDASIPSFSLNLRCTLKRDLRGTPFVDLPSVKIETPDGGFHRKRLVRWQTAQAEATFQKAAMAALRALLSRTGAPL